MKKTIIIAEAGVNHNGDIETAKRLIDVASDAGVDYVKFQTFKAEKLVSLNAKKAKNVDFKGKINVDIRLNSDYIYITINDNGVGFSGVDKTKMFTPYFTTKKEGTGLGLAIVGKIINDHNGEILLNSEYDGAMVEVKIPN